MTALEEWKAHFDKFGVKYTLTENGGPIDGQALRDYHNTTSLATDEGEGYSGFEFVVYFNKDGSFKFYGVWE